MDVTLVLTVTPTPFEVRLVKETWLIMDAERGVVLNIEAEVT